VNREANTQQWYQGYYDRRGADRNDLRANHGVLFQTLAAEASVVRAIRAIKHDLQTARILDVGCGGGADIYELVRLRYSHRNITGIDIRSECVAEAKQLWPQVCFIQGDASQMEFEDGCFDLVFESTMFATLPDDVLSAGIAAEMVRVCKPGGYLLLRDWRTPKPRDANYKALTKARLRKLFAVGRDTRVVGIHKGALVPPVGRFLSARLPSVYFLVAALLPMLVGQVSYLLQKSEQNTST